VQDADTTAMAMGPMYLLVRSVIGVQAFNMMRLPYHTTTRRYISNVLIRQGRIGRYRNLLQLLIKTDQHTALY
jgi:hypothetical protein